MDLSGLALMSRCKKDLDRSVYKVIYLYIPQMFLQIMTPEHVVESTVQ